MTYKERLKLYKRVGDTITKYFREKNHSIFEILILENEPIISRGVEFVHPVRLKIYLLQEDDYFDFYSVEKLLKDYFNIRIHKRSVCKITKSFKI